MRKFLLAMALVMAASAAYSKKYTIINVGLTFSPDSIVINANDTIVFNFALIHNVVEVSKATWEADGNTSNEGFTLPYGGGMLILTNPGKYYYVCFPHAMYGMKGIIVVNSVSTGINNNTIISQNFEIFPNPATDYINIKLYLAKRSHVTLALFDITGRQVAQLLSTDLMPGEFQQQFFLDRSSLKTGKYFLRSNYGNNTFTQSILIR
jgi:plastocyanin